MYRWVGIRARRRKVLKRVAGAGFVARCEEEEEVEVEVEVEEEKVGGGSGRRNTVSKVR